MADEKAPSISSIGELRGFFETFLPGLFLLFHLIFLFFSFLPATAVQPALAAISTNYGLASIAGLPAGYILGLSLRLMRTTPADRLSGRLARFIPSGRGVLSSAEKWWKRTKPPYHLYKPLRRENFPYPGLMLARVSDALTPEARVFYETTWAKVEQSADGPKLGFRLFRFGFLKGLVASIDERAAKGMYAAEMVVRHSAHVCYALFFSVVTLCIAAIQPLAITHALERLLFSVAVAEGLILFCILLPNLRLLRMLEVELVFTLCFRYREELRKLLKEDAARAEMAKKV